MNQIYRLDIDTNTTETIIQRIVDAREPIICSGIGKSGFVMQKFTASLNSIGIRAIFIDPLNALHGDIGVISPSSLLILMSNSGHSEELLSMVRALRSRNISTVLFTSSDTGNLNKYVDTVVKYTFSGEAGQSGLAPTTSSTIQMLIIDSVITSLTYRINLTEEKFALNHPAGSLGKRLRPISEMMKPLEEISAINAESTIIDAVQSMNENRVGACCIVDENNYLLGFITDGDIRRILEKPNFLNQSISTIMNAKPETVTLEERYVDIITNPKRRMLNCIPVIDKNNKLNGLLVQSETNKS